MTLGLTFVRGRTEVDNTETGSPVREAGQFDNIASLPIRATHRLQIPVQALTATQGAVIVYFEPDNAYNGGSQPATGILFAWTNGTNYFRVTYTKATQVLLIERKLAGVGTNLSISAVTFVANEAMALLIGWDATTLYGTVSSTISSVGNTSIPTGLPVTFDVGQNANTTHFLASYGAVVQLTRVPTADEWRFFHSLRADRPPAYGEGADETMSSLWYGLNTHSWKIADFTQMLDFAPVDSSIIVKQVGGLGIPPARHLIQEHALSDGSSYIEPALMDSRRVEVTLAAVGDSVQHFYDDIRIKMSSALNPKKGMGVLVWASPTNVYEIPAILEGGLGFDDEGGPTYQIPVITFLCPDPFWRRKVISTTVVVPVGGWVIPWVFPWTWTINAIDTTITNLGDVESRPTITFTATSTVVSPGITNNTTGQEFKLTGLTLVAGDVLVIDMNARTAVLNGTTNVLGYRGSSKTWALQTGANSITTFADSGTVSVEIAYPELMIGV